MLSLILLVLMIVLSVLFFNELGLKKVLIFNGTYWGVGVLLFLGVPGYVILLLHIAIVGTYWIVAKS
ncbi:hypothetical protein [Rubellicoccus peritrichatus]|uniref:Uncharacterized protein n=1 Tax=Rubellicoccus peritrichatus TaxID=3080537 RepID=A0AAQ3LIA5_9BACT|nr:hypothetical protein [Puniceicoccus sp. CR14]WOO42589.1 hypothetical protein RZN69_05760 [Puniceicoccus sp. CR14]